MKFLSEVQHLSGVCTQIRLSGEDELSARESFMSRHPTLKILSMMEIPEATSPEKCRCRTAKQKRAYQKARITQIRNNCQSIIEDETNHLTEGECLQLSRVACKLTHLLSRWTQGSVDLTMEGLL